MASSRKRRLKIKKGETHKSIEIKYCKPEISIQYGREYSKICQSDGGLSNNINTIFIISYLGNC